MGSFLQLQFIKLFLQTVQTDRCLDLSTVWLRWGPQLSTDKWSLQLKSWVLLRDVHMFLWLSLTVAETAPRRQSVQSSVYNIYWLAGIVTSTKTLVTITLIISYFWPVIILTLQSVNSLTHGCIWCYCTFMSCQPDYWFADIRHLTMLHFVMSTGWHLISCMHSMIWMTMLLYIHDVDGYYLHSHRVLRGWPFGGLTVVAHNTLGIRLQYLVIVKCRLVVTSRLKCTW